MFQSLRKLFASTKSSPAPRRAPLDLEALGERLVPSTVPNLVGNTLAFGSGRSLQITSESTGNGQGTFTGSFHDNALGVGVYVTGSIVPVSANTYNISYTGADYYPLYYGLGISETVVGVGVYTTSTTAGNHYQGWDVDTEGWTYGSQYLSYAVAFNTDSATPYVSFDGSGSVGHAAYQ